ncbi:damage-inducible protein DinB [Pseudoflavitalea sp. X16]|uniref:DinB family protein n=1 Tax=Paraflavitalea devenefica TaxID=2716334 RepID=UPI001422E358|nr:DinB family protein [Paraflavitalea devenefica]NII28382.1 damage-inducible protein DinB [Paraflavitalea devenefica]
MKAFFKELFEYNHHINQKLGSALNANVEKTSENAIKLYSHILNAHQIWNNRIDPRHPAFGVWEIHAIQDCQDIDKKNYEHILLIIERFDLNSMIHHPKIKGKNASKSIGEILFHVINHSTYHRGQLATEFRQNGLEPLATDYILYEKK